MRLLSCSILSLTAVGVVSTAVAAQSSRAGAEPGYGQIVNVVARDYAYEAPDTIRAGLTTFRVTESGNDPHMMQLFRIPPGRTYREAVEEMLRAARPPAWAVPAGGTSSNHILKRGDYTAVLRPGEYVLVCLISTDDRIRHVRKGMFRRLVVRRPAVTAGAAPRSDVTIRIRDGRISLSKTLRRGVQRVRVEQRGGQGHTVTLLQLNPGQTADSLLRWLVTRDGRGPMRAAGGTRPLPRRARVYFTADLEPGRYVIVCLSPAPGGRSHAHEGELVELRLD